MAKLEKLRADAQPHLDASEQVLVSFLGTCEAKFDGQEVLRTGIVMGTDRRVVFFAKKLAGYELESFPYPSISYFESGKDPSGHNLNFFAVRNKVSMKWIQDDDALRRLGALVRERQNETTTAPTVASVAPSTPVAPASPAPAPSAPAPAPALAAGWYVDPAGRHQHRYHNGLAWTANVANNGETSIDQP
jgi:Bacterial PH domain/Protein of unknown function (DUF2510)